MADLRWWKDFLMVMAKMIGMVLLSVVMRIKYWLDPEAKKRDLENMTKNKKFEVTDENRKYWLASDPDNMTDFLWTSKQLRSAFKAMMQDISKTASEFSAAPNPEIYDSEGNKKLLLSCAKKGVPLIINFGSCT